LKLAVEIIRALRRVKPAVTISLDVFSPDGKRAVKIGKR
jgi:hypothetical protein